MGSPHGAPEGAQAQVPAHALPEPGAEGRPAEGHAAVGRAPERPTLLARAGFFPGGEVQQVADGRGADDGWRGDRGADCGGRRGALTQLPQLRWKALSLQGGGGEVLTTAFPCL